MSSNRIVAEGSYIPTVPTNANPLRYRLRISEIGYTRYNYADVRIFIRGIDPCHWQQTNQMRFVGEWESVAPQTISGTGAGLCYFDMHSNLMLLGLPLYHNPTGGGREVWDIETVTGIGSILRISRFEVGDRGTGTQFAQPCSGPTCSTGSHTSGPIHPGKIRWECMPQPTPMGP
jgi:hypothetical protein